MLLQSEPKYQVVELRLPQASVKQRHCSKDGWTSEVVDAHAAYLASACGDQTCHNAGQLPLDNDEMQANYLSQLSPSVRAFVKEVELAAGLTIEVFPSDELNSGGPMGGGSLSIEIEATRVRLNAPTNGYFPDGAVRHEVLHVRRLHVEQVPQLVLAGEAQWNPGLEHSLTHVDNALEHLAIVPVELQHHPERQAHWTHVMQNAWEVKVPGAQTELDRRIDACLHWTFLRHVMPTSPVLDLAAAMLQAHNLRGEADAFAAHLQALLADKTEVARFFFGWFIELPKGLVALEYLNSISGRTQQPILD